MELTLEMVKCPVSIGGYQFLTECSSLKYISSDTIAESRSLSRRSNLR